MLRSRTETYILLFTLLKFPQQKSRQLFITLIPETLAANPRYIIAISRFKPFSPSVRNNKSYNDYTFFKDSYISEYYSAASFLIFLNIDFSTVSKRLYLITSLFNQPSRQQFHQDSLQHDSYKGIRLFLLFFLIDRL